MRRSAPAAPTDTSPTGVVPAIAPEPGLYAVLLKVDPFATEFEPNATELSLEALALVPKAIELVPLAVAPLP
ncbi:hypothetical protein DFR44_11257 [Hydromonas duriensis]|uniref:Uncharacterized protein n=1 Tax=Hydromonas duriensis TaxID=1527608 RepID=A0A4R6Y790_9BURK|nr:hypothetical protein DFR44_11257 [Hydromonas duriensis]